MRAMWALLAVLWLVPAVAGADEAAPKVVTLDDGDQLGRVSAEQTEIDDGPYKRQVVFYRSSYAPGTIVISTQERFLYLVLGNNRALRYGIGVGRQGFQ